MKQNVSETGSNRRFRKNVKTCLQKQKIVILCDFQGAIYKNRNKGTGNGMR